MNKGDGDEDGEDCEDEEKVKDGVAEENDDEDDEDGVLECFACGLNVGGW